jgi:transcription elongation factor S-II
MESTRAKVAARFRDALGGDDELARRLEVCLWNWTVSTCARDFGPHALYWANPKYRYRYTTRAQSLEFNLKAPGNPELARRVMAKELSVKAFAHMSPQEMWPEKWEDAYAKVAAKQLRREADVDASKAPDGAYTCGKCKSRKTVYTSIQIRSADEPMVRILLHKQSASHAATPNLTNRALWLPLQTNFVRCLNCGKSWKD